MVSHKHIPSQNPFPLSFQSQCSSHQSSSYSGWIIVARLGMVLVALNTFTTILLWRFWEQAFYIHALIIIGFVAIADIFLLVLGASTPGVIPKKLNNFEFHDQRNSIPVANSSKEKYREILIPTDTTLSKLKFCEECKIFRPRRTVHCSICNRCILQFDHHCEWIGVCVGKNNYSLFVVTVIALTTAMLNILGGCIRHFAQGQYSGFYEFIRSNFWMIIIAFLSTIFSMGLNGLLFYHFKLLWQGLTTNQNLKKLYGGYVYPFRHFSTWSCHRTSLLEFNKNASQAIVQHGIENLQTEKRAILKT